MTFPSRAKRVPAFATPVAARTRRPWSIWFAPAAGLAIGVIALSRARAQRPDSSLLTLDRLFSSSGFQAKEFGPAQWISGSVYTTVEPRAGGSGTDIVRYDAASGARTIFVPAARLIPPGDSAPMTIEDYTVSPDGRHVLVFTNS